MKDIIIPGDGYVYTFYIPNRNFQYTYINNLKTFTAKMSELDPEVQKRVNYPKTREDICVYELIKTAREEFVDTLKYVLTRI